MVWDLGHLVTGNGDMCGMSRDPIRVRVEGWVRGRVMGLVCGSVVPLGYLHLGFRLPVHLGIGI